MLRQHCGQQEEWDKENKAWAAQRAAQAEARAAALQAQRFTEDADALQALSQLKAVLKQQQPLFVPPLTSPAQQPAGALSSVTGLRQTDSVTAAGSQRATGSIGSVAAPGKHHRSASWVRRRASSFDDGSESALAAALLAAGPRAAHQKSSSHESGLPAKFQGPERQHSRLSSVAVPTNGLADGGQLQVTASQRADTAVSA